MRERPPPSSIGLDPLREPCPRPYAAAEVVEVPAGGDGEGDEERTEEEEEQDDERDVGAGGPLHVPRAVEELAEAQARVGDRLEEVVAVVECARRDAPRQVEGA